MRNVFGGLSFNLTGVAAEGAQGTSSHDCYNRLAGRRGNFNVVLYISMCKISSTAPLLVRECVCMCLRAWVCVCLRVAAHTSDWCTCSVTPLWFPTEETRFLHRCNIWFITIWNSTSVHLLCLKKSSQCPKEQGGKSTKEALPWNWQLLLCCAIWCICQGTEKG